MTTTVQHPESGDSKNWLIALLVTATIGTGLILMLFWLSISATLPFPDSPNEIVVMAESGISDESGGGFETSGGGSPPGEGSTQQETGGGATTSENAANSDDGGEITGNETNPVTSPAGSQVKPKNTPKASSELENLMKNLNSQTGTSASPTGNNGSGDPYSSGNGGGVGVGNGPGAGPGTGGPVGPGVGPGRFVLGNRKLEHRPTLSNPTQEEGVVCVEIVVDRNGRVIRATALSIGSTTTNSVLRSTARQSALQWKFNPDPSGEEEQIGKIFFNFSLK